MTCRTLRCFSLTPATDPERGELCEIGAHLASDELEEMNHNRLRSFRVFGVLFCTLGAAACSPTISTRGHLLDSEALATIRPGTQTREDVAEIIGTPTALATFDNRTWYYISERVRKVSFHDPEIIDRKIVAIDFDTKGVVQRIRHYQARDGWIVKSVGRETPTPGLEPPAIERFLGGMGDLSK